MIDRLRRPSRRPGPDPAATLAQRRQFMTFVWPLYALSAALLVIGTPLLFAPRYPPVLARPGVALGALAGLGTLVTVLLLRHPDPRRQQRALWLGELSGWTIAVGTLVLFLPAPGGLAPAALVFAAGAKAACPDRATRIRGVVIAEALLLAMAATQYYLLGMRDTAGAGEAIFAYTVLILFTSAGVQVVTGGLARGHGTAPAITAPAQDAPAPASAGSEITAPSLRAHEREAPIVLSRRLLEVLPYLGTTHDYQVLGHALYIKPRSVRAHLTTIAQKLGLPNAKRYEVVERAKALGLVTEDEIRRADEAVRQTLAEPKTPPQLIRRSG